MEKALFDGREIELLAPAGSYEGFEAALGAGADAVYAGGNLFGARAYAANFRTEELIRAIHVSHIHGKKFYLTVNTLLKEPEISGQLYEFLLPCYEAGLDGAIVQDLGVFRFIREHFPGLKLHASTQMTVTGPRGMKFLEEQGASRVVPARELSLSELAAMHQASTLEIETFIHGALCFSFSGRCLMSSLLGGRSGNRGRCAQPCRLPYQVSEEAGRSQGGKGSCPLSLKDLCTISLLPEILKAGVTSLKIEGRMKQPLYTAGVTAIYRKYLDLLLEEGPENYRVDPLDERKLLEVYSRGGSCDGYYLRHNGREMMDFANEKKTGTPQVEIRKRKEKIYGKLILFPGSPAILEVICRGALVRTEGEEVRLAQNQPMTEERARSQMDRLGNTEFVWEKLEILMGKDVFLPVKALNDLRRKALELLEEQLIRMGTPARDAAWKVAVDPSGEAAGKTAPHSGGIPKKNAGLSLYVSCETLPQAEALKNTEGIQGMYLPWDVMSPLMETDLPRRKELYLVLPHIVRGNLPSDFFSKTKKWMERGMGGFLVRDLEGFALVREAGFAERCVLDSSLYVWNQEAKAFWNEEKVLRDTVPVELNEKELRHRHNGGSELLIYGYLPLMVTAQCLRKNAWNCNKKEVRLRLKDRYQKQFFCVCCCRPWKEKTTDGQEDCYNIIYNSVPLSLLKEKEGVERLGADSLRLSFTLEEPEEAADILEEFLRVYHPAFPRKDDSGKEICSGKETSSGKENGSGRGISSGRGTSFEKGTGSGKGISSGRRARPGKNGDPKEAVFPGREFTKGHFKRGVQ